MIHELHGRVGNWIYRTRKKANGEPKIFGDRLYLYGSYDRFGGGYCGKAYHAVSAPLSDLTDLTDHGVSFSTDDVPWSDALLYAPDALYHNEKYYLFFCLSDPKTGELVYAKTYEEHLENVAKYRELLEEYDREHAQ